MTWRDHGIHARLHKNLTELLKRGEVNITLTCVHINQPVEDERFHEGIWQYLAHAGAFVTGQTDSDEASQCFGCEKDWTWKRVIRGFVLMEFIDVNGQSAMGTVTGLCPICWGNEQRLLKAFERDFGIKPDQIRRVHHEGGHA
jgi:hypothetical protein